MKIGLALGSGGARGFAHVAYLEALDELHAPIHCIAGASMGAFLGAYYAGGMSGTQMHALIKSFTLLDLNKVLDLSSIRGAGIIKGKKIEQFLDSTLPVKRFEDLRIPLQIVATDYWRREQVVFDKGDLAPAIRASISIPGIFEPYAYQGNVYIDGGVVNPVPFDLLADSADFIIGIDVNGRTDRSKIRNSVDVVMNSFEIMQTTIAEQRDLGRHVDLLCKPDMSEFNILEFYKSEKIISSVNDDVARFKQELVNRNVLRKFVGRR